MSFLVTVIIGGIVGWLASIIMKTNAQMGLIANVIVGIIGASLGFWAAGLLGLTTAGPFMAWLVAIAGAMGLIALLRALKVFA